MKEEWIVDSRASAHMSHTSTLMANYKASSSQVQIGDDSLLSVQGTRDIVYGDASLTDVLHVPHLSSNLLSISKATSKGLGFYFDDEVVEVIDRSSLSLVAHVTQQGGLYYVSSFSLLSLSKHESHLHQLFASSKAFLTKESSDLWHARYGHVPYATLHQLFMKDLVAGLPQVKQPRHHVCSSCAAGKIHQDPFPSQASS